jgi:hypothetical protein
MIKTGSPRVLWDHCIELEALIRSLTSNNVHMKNGEVSETIVTGSTADISHICEFGWYDWVIIRNGIMPHLWGIYLSHIYAREVR